MFDAKQMRDFFMFEPSASREGGPSSDPNVRQQSLQGKALKVTLRASHAGMRNGNWVMYSPAGMRDSLHTWTYPFNRPVQVHHDDHADPIGRAIGARYTPFAAPATNQDALFASRLLDEAITSEDVVDAANILDEAGVLDLDDWKGVGELLVDTIITDADAIQKILDGRYSMVSVSQRPKSAHCSVCKQDWVNAGPCEHSRGEVDKDSKKKCFLVVGPTKYSEVSFVNHPADEHASPEQMAMISIDGSPIQMDSFTVVPSSFTLVDSLEDEMPFTKIKDIVGEVLSAVAPVPVVPNPDLVTDPDEVTPAPTPVPTPDPVAELPTESVAVAQDADAPKEEPITPVEAEDPPLSETVAEALRLLFEEEVSFTEAHAEILNEAMEEGVSDAKLSTTKRKALPSSSFCGPKKSFPVNDCAHYTAALRLIGRYQGPGDKERIRSCIESKGKKLGCDGKDALTPSPVECLDCFSSDELISQYVQIEAILNDRKVPLVKAPCAQCAEKDRQLAEGQVSNEESDNLRHTLALVREDWKLILDEHIIAAEAHMDSLVELESCLRTLVFVHAQLTDKTSDLETIKTRIDSMTFDALRTAFSTLSFEETITFIRSGMARNPEEKINISDAIPLETKVVPPLSDEIKSYAEKVLNTRKQSGKRAAQSYLDQLIKRGKLPSDFDLYKAETIVAK